MNNLLSIVSTMLIGLLLWTATACQDKAAPAQETAPIAEEPAATSPSPPIAAPEEKSDMAKFQENMRTLIVDEENTKEPCTAYRVVDGNNASVAVSADLNALLTCPGFVTTSVVGNILIISDENGDLQQYNYEEQTLERILDLPNNSDGTSHVRWSSNNKKLAFIDINQDSYADKTMLYVFTFQNGKLIDQASHPIKANFSCASECMLTEKDFGFVDNQSIYYRTYDKAPYDIKGDDSKTTLKLTKG